MRHSIKVSVKLFIPLWREREKKKWEKADSVGNLLKGGELGGSGGCSDIQRGHKNQGNDRDILPENNKGGGRDCFLSLTAAVKHTQSWGVQQWLGAGEGWLQQRRAGRPPLPRHKGLPAGKKGDGETEGRRDRTAYRETRRGERGMQRKGRNDDTNMTFDDTERRCTATDHPHRVHTATPRRRRQRRADQNNMAERRERAALKEPAVKTAPLCLLL